MKKAINTPVTDQINRAAANRIQAKLTVNQPGDRYEQEADRIADTVMSMPEPNIQKSSSDDEEEKIQMSRDIGDHVDHQPAGREINPGIENHLKNTGNSGTNLSGEIGSFMESRFGTDFRDVRIHTDSDAVQMSRELGANAFTSGRDIYFNEGKFDENSQEGRHLLSHELTHVVQQGNSEPVIQRDGIDARFGTVEAFSILHPRFLTGFSRPLTQSEIALARTIFRESVDYIQVSVSEAYIANAPTTLASTIRIAPGSRLDDRTLIHELGHVWQFQTQGSAYISHSITCQIGAMITAGNRGAAYRYTIVPGQSIHGYNPEQQASIIEDYFANPSLRMDPEYDRMIEEVRSATPSAAPVADALQDIPNFQPQGPRQIPSSILGPGSGADSFTNEGATIPQLELRFRGLDDLISGRRGRR